MKTVTLVGLTNLRPDQVERLRAACDLRAYGDNVGSDVDPTEIVARSAGAEIVVVNSFTPITAEIIARLPALRVVVSCSSGIDHVDLAACGDAGVNVRWFPGYCARTLAEKAVTYLMMGFTRVLAAIDHVRAGGWDYFGFQAREAPGRRVVIIGSGATGRIVHDLCAALGFSVVAVTSQTDDTVVRDLLRSADAVTLHMDLNDRSRGFFNRDRIALLKEDAIIVNNARGDLVDDEALQSWLTEHPAATAFLDVSSIEPVPPTHPYRHLPNVYITPHIGWNSQESDKYLAGELFDAIMTAIDSGWTTESGALGSQLLLGNRTPGR